MDEMKIYTKAEFIELLQDQEFDSLGEVLGKVNSWLGRRDGVAIYRNEDLGHPEVGHVKLVSFGSPAAQLEVMSPLHLPDTMPDNLPAGAINWRYTLQGIYRGSQIGLAEAGVK